MAEGNANVPIKYDTISGQLDEVGRISILLPINRIINAFVISNNYLSLMRYNSEGVTLIYCYNRDNLQPVTSRPEVTIGYLYY